MTDKYLPENLRMRGRAKPCPFCGSEVLWWWTMGNGDYFIQCLDCVASGPPASSLSEATDLWNNRTEKKKEGEEDDRDDQF